MKSVMQYSFGRNADVQVGRSVFNRSHGYKTTFDAGYLIPIFLDEALPGDTLNLSLTALARLGTPIVPLMDNVFMDFFFFFTPSRLLWTNWQRFMGERDPDPDSSIAYVMPTIDVKGALDGTLADYFGLPIKHTTGWTNDFDVVSLPFRNYNLIWNQWFRDQNLQDSVAVDLDDGPDDLTDYVLLRRGKRYDYFTSCLPSPQKGDAVEIPLGTSAEIDYRIVGDPGYNTVPVLRDPTTGAAVVSRLAGSDGSGLLERYTVAAPPVGGGGQLIVDPAGSLYADLSTATAATINSLRQSYQIQSLLERDMRGGTRYVELLKSHFGVTSPDFRLQRPEYIGGGEIPVSIHQVAQTSSTDVTTPQGNLAAYGVSGGHAVGFTYSAVEHGYIMGLVSVRADLTYQQGVDRMWTRSTRHDFMWPSFVHLGEQAVLNREIWWTDEATQAINIAAFGYQERYAEYRFKKSLITGLFRSDSASPLDVWHLSQDFSALPVLNDSFIQDNPPIDRVIAVSSEPQFLFDSYFQVRHTRPLPVFGTPYGMGGRF